MGQSWTNRIKRNLGVAEFKKAFGFMPFQVVAN